MNALVVERNQLWPGREPRLVGGEWLAWLSWLLLPVEGFVAFTLGFVAVLAFATIYFMFVGFLLVGVALVLCAALSLLGALLALAGCIACRRQGAMLLPAATGLLCHTAIAVGACWALAGML